MYCSLFTNMAPAHLKNNYDVKFTLEHAMKAQGKGAEV